MTNKPVKGSGMPALHDCTKDFLWDHPGFVGGGLGRVRKQKEPKAVEAEAGPKRLLFFQTPEHLFPSHMPFLTLIFLLGSRKRLLSFF